MLFERGQKDISRRFLMAVPALCIQCHMQGGGFVKEIFVLREDDLSGDSLERAEFLFATRNFQEALKVYDKAIEKLGVGRGLRAAEVRDMIFSRKLSYYVRTKRDFKSASAELKKWLKKSTLSESQRNRLNSWLANLEQLAVYADQDLPSPKLVAQGSRIFSSDPEKVDSILPEAFWVAGLLSDRRIHEEKGALTPESLYWSGKAKRYLSNFSGSSAADLFFRECALSYPNDPMGAKCTSELELALQKN